MEKGSYSAIQDDLNIWEKSQGLRALPSLEQRKLQSSIQEQQRYTQKNSNFFQETTKEKSEDIQHQLQDGIKPARQAIFSVPNDSNVFKKRVFISPNKLINRQRLYETLESELLKKQIEELRTVQQESTNKDVSVFASALKQFGLLEKEEKLNSSSKPVSKSINQPYKKKSAANQRDRLKPITSQVHIKNGELQYLNGQKIMLLDAARSKKSNSLVVKAVQDDKIQDDKISNKGKIIKDINVLRMRLQKGVKLAGTQNQITSKFSQPIPFNINIRTIDVKSDTFRQMFENTVKKKTQNNEDDEEMPKKQTVVHITFRNREPIEKATTEILKETDKQKEKVVTYIPRKNSRKFNIPFETYYYRDLLWKVNFSNGLFVESPQEYDHRLKAFVGKGNNSCMVSGLIARRPWFAFTDKLEQANFVWSQLKKLQFFKKQDQFKDEISREHHTHSKYVHNSLLTDTDISRFKAYFQTYMNSQEHGDERFVSRLKHIKYRKQIKSGDIKQTRMMNHLINNYVLGNKKALFNTMANYYKQVGLQVFDFLPLTFHIRQGLQDQRYFQFLKYYHKRAKQIRGAGQKGKNKQYNAWIVKPGENSNRGNGIKMCLTLQEIKNILKQRQRYADGSYRTYIVQAYLQRPLLYFKRKFDLRHYIMMTCMNGCVKGYWYRHGYVRTTSSQYSLKSNSGSIHLTNDAVQKNLADYGKYQKGNKISYDDLSAYIDKYHHKKGAGFYGTIYPKMKRIAADAMRACSGGIDPRKLQNNFQVFGMDFMIDANLQVWLIEINTNPCLQLSCPLLGCIIPKMIENALQLTLDALFPPPIRYSPKGLHYYKQLQKQNGFELVFDERLEKLCLGSMQVLDNKLLEEEDDTFQDCGEDWQDS